MSQEGFVNRSGSYRSQYDDLRIWLFWHQTQQQCAKSQKCPQELKTRKTSASESLFEQEVLLRVMFVLIRRKSWHVFGDSSLLLFRGYQVITWQVRHLCTIGSQSQHKQRLLAAARWRLWASVSMNVQSPLKCWPAFWHEAFGSGRAHAARFWPGWMWGGTGFNSRLWGIMSREQYVWHRRLHLYPHLAICSKVTVWTRGPVGSSVLRSVFI